MSGIRSATRWGILFFSVSALSNCTPASAPATAYPAALAADPHPARSQPQPAALLSDHQQVDALQTRLMTANFRLDLLEAEGADDHFPAALLAARRQHLRASRAFAGNLRYDAFNDDVLLQAMVGELERRMAAIGRHPMRLDDTRLTATSGDSRHLLDKLLALGFVIKQDSDTSIDIYPMHAGAFASGSHQLQPGLIEVLDGIARLCSDMAQLTIYLRGHTDNVGSTADNSALAARRAEAVASYLSSRGVPSSRIHLSSAGEAEPYADNSSPHNRELNRRVQLRLSWH